MSISYAVHIEVLGSYGWEQGKGTATRTGVVRHIAILNVHITSKKDLDLVSDDLRFLLEAQINSLNL